MVRKVGMFAALVAAIVLACSHNAAKAQTEFPPPQGKGPVIVVVSGQLGAAYYASPAKDIAALGYDVILLDGNAMAGSHGRVLLAAVRKAQSSPHGNPGRVGMIGFSLGGGEALFYASRWPDLVAVIVAWYPLTSPIRDPASFVAGIKVPVLMFAGELDHYKNCCLISTARGLAAAAGAQDAPLEVVSYPNTEHDFIFSGTNYNAAAATDSWRRAEARLAQYLGH